MQKDTQQGLCKEICPTMLKLEGKQNLFRENLENEKVFILFKCSIIVQHVINIYRL